MTVTGHFINAQWQLRSRVLCTALVEGSDTASGIQKELQTRGISEKIKTFITSDNSPNLKTAVVKDSIRNLEDVNAAPNLKWRKLLLRGTALLLVKKTNFFRE